MRLSNLRFPHRLAALTVFLLLVAGACGWSGLSGAGAMFGLFERVYHDEMRSIAASGTLVDTIHRIRARAFDATLSADPKAAAKMIPEIDDYIKQANTAARELKNDGASTEEAALVGEITQGLNSLSAFFRGVVEKAGAGDFEGARKALASDSTTQFRKAATPLRKLTETHHATSGRLFEEGEGTFGRTRTIALSVLIAGLLAGGVVAALLSRSITRPIDRLLGVMERLRTGDVDVVIPDADRRDEVGDIARAMETFRAEARAKRVLEEERAISAGEAERSRRATRDELVRRLRAGVGEVSARLQSAARAMEENAVELRDTSHRSLESAGTVTREAELSATDTEVVAVSARDLAVSVSEVGRHARTSNEIVRRTVTETEAARNVVAGLAELGGQIGAIVDLIRAIAGQTNLLALNATIEAARAGEAGKGFAVVAGEVKNLATQTERATGDITAQVARVRGETARAVEALSNIGAVTAELGGIAAAIANAVDRQSEGMGSITRTAEHAAEGAKRVSAAMGDVERAARGGGETSERSLAAARDLARDADTLRREVDAFLEGIG